MFKGRSKHPHDGVNHPKAPTWANPIASVAINDYKSCMTSAASNTSSITIRNLDRAVKERLRIRAAQHGHSMEAEARSILQATLKEPEKVPSRNLYERIRARFEPLGGADDLQLPPRLPDRDPPTFD